MINVAWWEKHAGAAFLADDRGNPARAYGARLALRATTEGAQRTLAEIGPGPGFDYEDHFRPAVLNGLIYSAVDATPRFCAALRARFPEIATVLALPVQQLPAAFADVIYSRAVLEHQAELDPGLRAMLRAARRVVIITWYRPPSTAPCYQHNVEDDVYYNTYARADVSRVVFEEGFVGGCVKQFSEAEGGNAVDLFVRQ